MTIYSAKRLALASGKDVIFLPVDMEHYRAVSERVMELLEDEAEEGGAFEQRSIDEAYLDVTERSHSDWKSAEDIGISIKRKVREIEGLTCSVGIGPNKFVAKMASKHRKPDGLTVVKSDEVSDFLSSMPVSKLHGIGEKTASLLEELGIKTAKDILESDASVLAEKFGVNKARVLIERARGIDESHVEAREIQQISRIGTLSEDTDDVDVIFGKIKELSAGLGEKIKKRNVAFGTVSVIFIDTAIRTQTRSRSVNASDDVGDALAVARVLILEFMKENPSRKLRRVGIGVSNLVFRNRNLKIVSGCRVWYFAKKSIAPRTYSSKVIPRATRSAKERASGV